MGSTGSGSFSDYQGYGKGKSDSSNQNGGTSGVDQCSMAFSTYLEEISLCEFYKKTGTVPDEGSNIYIVFDKRLVAINDEGVYIGYLPTKYNYLRVCISDGFSYTGVINKSTDKPIPSISIDIAPSHE